MKLRRQIRGKIDNAHFWTFTWSSSWQSAYRGFNLIGPRLSRAQRRHEMGRHIINRLYSDTHIDLGPVLVPR